MNQTVQIVRLFGQEIITTVTDMPHVVDDWVKEIPQTDGPRIVGLACEWNPHSSPGMPNRVPTLQLFTFNKCLIVQLLHMAEIPESLNAFLSDPNVFVGAVGQDAEKLGEQYGLKVANSVNLEKLALVHEERDWAGSQLGFGFRQSALGLCGFLMLKPFNASEMDWEARVLTELQIRCGCVDAYVSYMLGCKLMDDYCSACLRGICVRLQLLAI